MCVKKCVIIAQFLLYRFKFAQRFCPFFRVYLRNAPFLKLADNIPSRDFFISLLASKFYSRSQNRLNHWLQFTHGRATVFILSYSYKSELKLLNEMFTDVYCEHVFLIFSVICNLNSILSVPLANYPFMKIIF